MNLTVESEPTFEVEMKSGTVHEFEHEPAATRFLMNYGCFINAKEVRMKKNNGTYEVRYEPKDFMNKQC